MTETSRAAIKLVTRHDPDIPPMRRTDVQRDEGERGLIADQLALTARDATTVLQALAIHDAFLTEAGATSLVDADPDVVAGFVLAGTTQAAQHLRRNVLLTVQRILAGSGRIDATHVLETIRPALDPVPARSAPRPGARKPSDREAQVVVATSDEVHLLRNSVKFARSRDEHRPGAALAIATAGGCPPEAPGVCWHHVHQCEGRCTSLDLSGTHLQDPDSLRFQAARTIELDPWESRTMTLWFEEANPHADSKRSVIYTAHSGLTSVTAVKSVVRAINVVREAAALEHSPGATPAGLAYWSAAHTLGYHGLDAAVARHGSSRGALLHKLGLDL